MYTGANADSVPNAEVGRGEAAEVQLTTLVQCDTTIQEIDAQWLRRAAALINHRSVRMFDVER